MRGDFLAYREHFPNTPELPSTDPDATARFTEATAMRPFLAMPNRRFGPWLVRSTKRSIERRPLFTWSSMIGTSVCTPVMPEGEAG